MAKIWPTIVEVCRRSPQIYPKCPREFCFVSFSNVFLASLRRPLPQGAMRRELFEFLFETPAPRHGSCICSALFVFFGRSIFRGFLLFSATKLGWRMQLYPPAPSTGGATARQFAEWGVSHGQPTAEPWRI